MGPWPKAPQWWIDEHVALRKQEEAHLARKRERRRQLWREFSTACAAFIFGFVAGVLVCAGII